jgi:hypothetical protein
MIAQSELTPRILPGTRERHLDTIHVDTIHSNVRRNP